VDEMSRRSVHHGVNRSQQGGPGLVVKANDHARVRQILHETVRSFAPTLKKTVEMKSSVKNIIFVIIFE